MNAEAQAFGKYGAAAQGKAQLGGGQGADVQMGAQAGANTGLMQMQVLIWALVKAPVLISDVQLGGNKGIELRPMLSSAAAKAQASAWAGQRQI